MSRKYTYERVKEIFEEAEAILLAKEYKGNSTKMDYICRCGRKGQKSLSSLLQSKGCNFCRENPVSERRRLSLEQVKDIFKENGLTLLAEEYINSKTPLEYICECGNTSTINVDNVRAGKKCRGCAGKRSREKLKTPYDKVKLFFEENGCVLLEDEYINEHVKMKYICQCGETWSTSFSNFRAGKRCWNCGNKKIRQLQLLSFEDVKEIFRIGGCVLLEEEYKNARTPMQYICECGNVAVISIDNFKKGNRCRNCKVEKCREAARKYSYDFIEESLSKAGFTLLEKELPKGDKKVRCLCPQGHSCNIVFNDFVNHNRGCRECYYESIRGENHPNWNPHLTLEEREQGRFNTGYQYWVKEVYKRDNYTCQCCGKRSGKLNAHHILNYSSHKELRTDLNNGITFCEDCHIAFHKIYGRKANNKEQVEEYIKLNAERV